jgi:glycosyltransferase involved in cell wall biosynthesis
MMSGTPVLALAHGAAPEIIDPGVTGFLADDLDGLAAAYQRIGEIDLERCVQVARERFGPARMAQGYMNVYRSANEVAFYRRPFN